MDTRDAPRYAQRPELETIELDSEISIFDGASTTLMLNHTASMIWLALGQYDNAIEIAAELAALYDQDPEQLRGSVQTALDELVDLGVVEPIR